MKQLDCKNFRNILIIKPSSLGDVVRTLPILHGLHQSYPQARISWLIRSDLAPILHNLDGLHEIIEFDRRCYGKFFQSLSAGRKFLFFLYQLFKRRFDLVLDLQGLFRSGFFSRITGAPVRIGLKNAREFAFIFYTQRINVPDQREHVVESYWSFAHFLGFGHLEKNFMIQPDSGSAQSAAAKLRQAGLDADSPYMVMLAGGTASAKLWPVDRFAALVDALYKQYGMTVVLIGAGQVELDAAQQVVRHVHNKDKIINLVNQTNLLQATAILKRARLVIGNDSGPLHLAAALSVPLVGLYGPTDPGVVGPYAQTDGIVQAGAAVPRKRKQRYSQKPDHRMQNITVEQVLKTIEIKLAKEAI